MCIGPHARWAAVSIFLTISRPASAEFPGHALKPAARDLEELSHVVIPSEVPLVPPLQDAPEALPASAEAEDKSGPKAKDPTIRKKGLKRLPPGTISTLGEFASSIKTELQSDRLSGAMQQLGALFQGQAARGTTSLVRARRSSNSAYNRYVGDMGAFLKAVNGKGPITVSVEGKSSGGRPLYLVHLNRNDKASWKVFFYAQQHGCEVSGRDALLRMIQQVADKPERLPPEVDLWVMPSVNPDGAATNRRENAAGVDLNRDHMQLEQPETQTLHRIFRKLRPQVAVDCHEFNWNEDFKVKGWAAWPTITMDGLNNPLLDPRLISAALRWVNEADDALRKAGYAYLRYSVGGLPPEEERRYSAPDMDGALNALGTYGGLSFIIEANSASPRSRRVDAYQALLWRFIRESSHRQEDRAAIEQARQRPLPAFLPTNYFWANVGPKTVEFPVMDAATRKKKVIATPNFMTDLVVKMSVPTPRAYVIDAAAAAVFRGLLERQGIPYETMMADETQRAERCRLLRVEKEFDDVYGRYEGRQIVQRDEAADRIFPAGSLLVSLTGEAALRAALLLEPSMVYGLYQYPKYKALVGPGGVCPVWRILPLK